MLSMGGGADCMCWQAQPPSWQAVAQLQMQPKCFKLCGSVFGLPNRKHSRGGGCADMAFKARLSQVEGHFLPPCHRAFRQSLRSHQLQNAAKIPQSMGKCLPSGEPKAQPCPHVGCTCAPAGLRMPLLACTIVGGLGGGCALRQFLRSRQLQMQPKCFKLCGSVFRLPNRKHTRGGGCADMACKARPP
jgi:hypothetical protein